MKNAHEDSTRAELIRVIRGKAGDSATKLALNLSRQRGLCRQLARLREEEHDLCAELALVIPRGETRDILAWGHRGERVHLSLYHQIHPSSKGMDDSVDCSLTVLDDVGGAEWGDAIMSGDDDHEMSALDAAKTAADMLRMPADRSLKP